MVHISSCCCTVRGYGKREAICWSLPRLPKQGKQKKPRSGLWNVPRRYPTESSDDLDWVVGYWIWMDLGVRITLMVQSLAYQMRLGGLCFSGSPGHCLSSSNLRNICQICQIDSSIWQERIQLLEEVVDIFFVDLQLLNYKMQLSVTRSYGMNGVAHKPLHICLKKEGPLHHCAWGEKRQLEITPIAMNILIDASAKRSFGQKTGKMLRVTQTLQQWVNNNLYSTFVKGPLSTFTIKHYELLPCFWHK